MGYKTLYSNDSLQNKRFYNIGAGNFRHQYWSNVDYDSNCYARNRAKTLAGLPYDILSLEPLPIETLSAEIVYSSHTLEHVTDAAAQNVLNESYRILKPGGYLRLTMPNINLHYQAYVNNDRAYYYWANTFSKPSEMRRIRINIPMNKASMQQLFLYIFAASLSTIHSDGASERIDDKELDRIFQMMSLADALTYCCSKCPLDIQRKYPGNHINWFNYDKLSVMLYDAGFKNYYLSGYGQSLCPVMRETTLFDATHPKMSLYVEALKD